MTKLEDYYHFFDMFKGKLNEEQKKILGQLEDQIIAEEILPAISKSVAPVLTNLRRNLTLVVDYDTEKGITVRSTRDKVVVKEHTAKEYQIPSTKKVVKVAEAQTQPQEPKTAIKRSPATGLCVWLPDGDFIQEKKANQTMVKAIERAGADNVERLHIPHNGSYLVASEKHEKYAREMQLLSNGHYLNTHSSTASKKRQLEKISNALHLGWKIEVIE